jgi:hypothetical protein
MRILMAEDDPISHRILESTLKKLGYDLEALRMPARDRYR